MFERGDRVMTVHELEGGFLGGDDVPKGTIGIVMEYSRGGFLSDEEVTVRFENDVTCAVNPDDVHKL